MSSAQSSGSPQNAPVLGIRSAIKIVLCCDACVRDIERYCMCGVWTVDGKFGSTQGTVLALKALLAYEEYRAHNSAAMIGAISLKINGNQVCP